MSAFSTVLRVCAKHLIVLMHSLAVETKKSKIKTLVPRDLEAEKEEKEDETEEKEDETEVVYGGSTENLCWQCRILLEL